MKEHDEEQESEVHDFNKPDFEFIPKGAHAWRQQGPYCMCKSCDLEHGVYIGVKKIMVGIGENGLPILEDKL